MAVKERKFKGRASRYNLKPFHDKTISYSNAQLSLQTATDFLNISSSGLAFVAQEGTTPEFGSIIKITFPIPEQSSLTVRAQVVRLDSYRRPKWYQRYYNDKDELISEFVVGVHFLNIKRENQKQLATHLFRLIESEKKERREQKLVFFKDGLKKSYTWILLSFICVLLTALSLNLYFNS